MSDDDMIDIYTMLGLILVLAAGTCAVIYFF